MSKHGGSFFAFLLGIITGGIIGILYAPDKGTNTRDKLSYQLDKLKIQLEGFVKDIVDEKGTFSTDAKNKGEKIVNEAKNKAEQLLGDVNGLINQIKKN